MGPEFVLAFQAARLALDGIRSCITMLNEGKVEIQRIKKDVEQGVGDAKAIYKEVTGIWAWLKGLLGEKPPVAPVSIDAVIAPPAAAEPKAATKAKKSSSSDEYVDYIPTPDEIVEQFLTHFSSFVEAQTTILDTIAEKREQILHVWNPKQNNKKVAIELIRYERRIDDMALELSELMASGPRKLGSVRDEFKEKLDIVQNAQRRARDAQRRKEAQEAANRSNARDERINRNITIFWSLMTVLYTWSFMWVIWLNHQ